MSQGKTELLSPDPAGIARAAELLSVGQLVALPTETVYGLAGDATSDMACARIFEAKGRPRFNPLIVHLPSLDQVAQIAIPNDTARALAAAFWPGPMTLVLPLRGGHGLSPLVTAGLDTVAIRLPAHPLMRGVLDRFGGPIAAPSANPSGRISPTTADHVLNGLTGRIAAVLNGGPCGVGLESTILAPTKTDTRLLREGGLPREAIEPLTGPLITDATPGKIQAPGQLSSHYAPRAQLRLNSPLTDPAAIRVSFGPCAADLSLSATGDLTEAAAKLFSTLHAADALARARDAAEIHIAPIPVKGLGRAINDRLTRAAAPR